MTDRNMQVMMRKGLAALAAAAMAWGTPASAQVTTVDPTAAAQADVAPPPADRGYEVQNGSDAAPPPPATPAAPPPTPVDNGAIPAIPSPTAPTWRRDDLIGAAEGVFGKGAADIAGLIERVLKDQGEPNAYIAGREASGAFVFGLRYGSGTLSHKIEGQRPVYWTGPSVGFDVGGDAARVFVLVYNLYDSQDLYERFPQVEGRAYFVGGLAATYLRRDNVVLIPVRLGVGVRLGANIGYMKFSEKQKWMPF